MCSAPSSASRSGPSSASPLAVAAAAPDLAKRAAHSASAAAAAPKPKPEVHCVQETHENEQSEATERVQQQLKELEEIEDLFDEQAALRTLRDFLAERGFCSADVDLARVADVPFVVDREPAAQPPPARSVT
jgi:hypothetical protein